MVVSSEGIVPLSQVAIPHTLSVFVLVIHRYGEAPDTLIPAPVAISNDVYMDTALCLGVKGAVKADSVQD